MLVLNGDLQKVFLDHILGQLQEKVAWLTERL